MMRAPDDLPAVYVCTTPCDFRKQIDGLAAIVQEVLALDPFSRQLFVFTNKRRDRCRILYWERSGFVLWMKRLERERFHWPAATPGQGVLTLSGQQLNWLLDGYDLSRWRPHDTLHYTAVA